MDTPQNSQNSMNTGPQKNTLMGVLSYIGPFVIISYLTAKDDPFVKFHIKQGLVLLVIEILLWLLSMFMWPLWMIWQIINFVTIILSIIGIINVVKGKEKELPIVGSHAKHFNF
jgi:uncharacterized membrane protein